MCPLLKGSFIKFLSLITHFFGYSTSVSGTLKKGGRVSLVGFGSWSVSRRAARDGRNPQTGATIKIAAKNVVKFKAGAELSGSIN